jgi:hypothetical protein
MNKKITLTLTLTLRSLLTLYYLGSGTIYCMMLVGRTLIIRVMGGTHRNAASQHNVY